MRVRAEDVLLLGVEGLLHDHLAPEQGAKDPVAWCGVGCGVGDVCVFGMIGVGLSVRSPRQSQAHKHKVTKKHWTHRQ
jgi:hypothetical protein